jgi:hypothetical protein
MNERWLFMRRLLQVGMLLLLLLAAGCSDQAAPPGGSQTPQPGNTAPQPTPAVLTAQSYFPIKAGSSWTYQGEGNEFASFTREVIYSKDNRGQFKESNGGTVSSAVFEVNADAVTRIFFKGEEYEPDNLLEDPAFTGNDNTVMIKAPLTAGTTWTSGNMEKKIVSVDATIDTPAGKFEKCLQIEARTPESLVTEYYQEKVGLVKREFRSGDALVTSTLSQYMIAP